MTNQRDDRTSQAQLLGIIRQVRNRWRLKVALRGAAIVLGVGFLVFLATAVAVDQFRYSEGSVLAFRIVSYVALLALTIRFLVLPLLPRVSDERVALYLEEHEPSLDAAVLSAVELADEKRPGVRADMSPALSRRLVENAVQRTHAIDDGRRVERLTLFRSTGALAGIALAALAVLVLGPPFLKHSAKLLLFPFNVAEAASPYRVALQPGNITIPRGGDQKIEARLQGFEAEVVELAMKRGAEGEWQRMSMVADVDSGNHVFLLLDIDDKTEYYVEASGVRSPVYRIDVVDLPYVQKLEMEYRFPAYTGLSPQKIEEGGDIAALKGTVVTLRAVPTMPTAGGRIIVEGGDTIPLTVAADGSLSGKLTVSKEGFYKIELEAPDKSMVKASLDYTIDVLVDQPPSIRFREPGRDLKVSSVEEVFTEVVAEDDYGVRKVEIVYSVNGAPEQTLPVHSATARRTPDVSAGHTFLLEELSLEPGDFLSYYARATDNNSAGGAQVAATDIYFMEVRPYAKDYKQAEQPPGGGGGGGAGGEEDQDSPQALSRKQRDIIAGTYKVMRDKARYSPKEFTENLATLRLAQEKLREAVATLAGRLVERGIAAQDTGFAKIAAMLPKAADEMKGAEARLRAADPKGALSPEQKALQQLQRAEAVFREVTVSQGGGGGGGGGGEQQSNAEDLADLFELERDKMRNQYETVERAQAEQADRKSVV